MCTICGTQIPLKNVLTIRVHIDRRKICIAQQIQWIFENRPVDNLSPRKKKIEFFFLENNKSFSVQIAWFSFVEYDWTNVSMNDLDSLSTSVYHYEEEEKLEKHNAKQIKLKTNYKLSREWAHTHTYERTIQYNLFIKRSRITKELCYQKNVIFGKN